ncbi:hypothetical protein GCM10023093_21970 [Nemorincola caseinilytica]|uniref:tRNA_anti-like n=1 Tax=Nemorincola caseinilytica TaxID=2054315 RepID=A0ABP8NGH2_9BACT
MARKIILAVLALVLIGVGTGIYLWYKPHATVDNKKGIEVTAQALAQAYTNNEAQANTLYLNKVIEVTGSVTETEQNQDGGLMVILDNDVQCALREKGIQTSKGQTLTIKGFCSGNGMLGVSLTDCIIKE